MTVNELHEKLSILIFGGQGDLEVIANCDFTIDGVHYEKLLIYLESVYYQSGDIELAFSDKE